MNRRLLALAAAAILLFVAAGCGKNAGVESSPPAPGGGGSPSASGATSSGGTSSGGTSGGTTDTATGGSQAGPSGTGGSPGPSGGSQQATPPQGEKASVGPLQVGEAATVGPLTVTLRKIDTIREVAGLAPGYVYLMADLQVKNDGGAPYTINVTEHFRMETPEAKKAPYNMQAAGQRSPKLQGTVDQGQAAEGWLGHLSKDMAGTFKYQFIHPDYGDATWEFTIQ